MTRDPLALVCAALFLACMAVAYALIGSIQP